MAEHSERPRFGPQPIGTKEYFGREAPGQTKGFAFVEMETGGDQSDGESSQTRGISRVEYDASGLPTEAAMQIEPVDAWSDPAGYADRKTHQVLCLTDLVRGYDEAYHGAASHEGYLDADRPVGSEHDEEDYR